MELDDDEKAEKSDPPPREGGGKRTAVSVTDDLGDIEFDLIDEVDVEDTINDVFARDTAIPAPAEHLSGEHMSAEHLSAELSAEHLSAEHHAPEPLSVETIRPFDEDELEQGLKLATELSAPSLPPMRPQQHTPITVEPASEELEFDSFEPPVDIFGHPIPGIRPRQDTLPQESMLLESLRQESLSPNFGQSEAPTAPPLAARGLLEQAKRSLPVPDRAHRPAFMAETARNPAFEPDSRSHSSGPESDPDVRVVQGRSDPATDSALDFVDGFDPLLDDDSLPPMSGFDRPTPHSSTARAGPQEMQECYAVGDFSRALSIAEDILARSPDDPSARRCAQNCRDVLTQMFAARIGPLDQVISVAISPAEVQWLSLDHRAGFLLSLVDGQSTVDEILDISGMTRLDALKIIFDLTQQQVVRLA